MRRLASTRALSFCIVDTTVVSVLAYEYAKQRAGFLGDIRSLALGYIPLFDQGRLEETDLWVFLMPGLVELRRRIDAKGGTRHLLEMDRGIVEADVLRDVFRTRYLTLDRQILIDNSRLSVAQSIQKIVAFLSRPRNVARVRSPLKGLLRDLASGKLVLDEPYSGRVTLPRRGRSQ